MKKLVCAVALVLFGCVAASADDALRQAGLVGMEMISDADGAQVRGQASSVTGTGLSSISALIYDSLSGSRFNLDSIHFNTGSDGNTGATTAATSGTQFETLASVTGFAVSIASANNGLFTAALDATVMGVNWSGAAIAVPNLTGLLYRAQ